MAAIGVEEGEDEEDKKEEEEEEEEEGWERGGGMQVGRVLVLLDKVNATGAAEPAGEGGAVAAAAKVRVEGGVRWGGGTFSMLVFAL